MPCSVPIDRAGPTILDIPILSDQDAADSAIDEQLPIPPPLLRLRLPDVLPRPIPMDLAAPSMGSRSSTIYANPPLSSLSVSDLRLLRGMSQIALPASLRPRVLEDGSASPETGMRIGSPPSHPKALIPSFYRLVWVVLQVQTRKPFSESIRRGLACDLQNNQTGG